MYVNPQSFRQWWDVFHADCPLTEIRLLGEVKGRTKTASGYFKDCETALNALMEYPDELGAYAPINAILEACYGRSQRDCIRDGAKATTSGSDIEGRRWIMIDFDPVRPTGTNSSDEEKRKALSVMTQVGCFLRDQGFSAPVVADSANGYHLYYRVSLANTPENTQLVVDFLTVLDMFYSDEYCDIDRQVSDPNRISKIIGTRTVKGADAPDRPRRESKFLKVPEDIEITDVAFLRKIAGMLPAKEEPSRFNGYRDSFDIEAFIRDHGIDIAKRSRFKDGEKLVLAHCPFNPEHKAPDAAIFIMDSGAIGFKCLHNSCSGYTWKDVRLHYDPEAYSRRDYAEYERKRDFYSTAPRPAPVVLDESDERGRKWLSMREIEWQDPSKLTYIPTGFTILDRKIGGLALGDVTIISGLAGAGKTSILNNILLSTIQHGYKAAIWSGELSPSRFKSWINQAAAGANFVKKGVGETEYWYCPKEIATKIDAWTEGKFYLYNNNYGNKSSQILKDVRECVKEHGTQLLVFDNKMAMMLDSYEGDKNEREAGLINELKDFAIASQLHIILVCHPRKEQMHSLLRMESIAGNSDLYNAASNVLLCHRVGRDFEKRATEFFGRSVVEELTSKGYNEVIEVAKNRSHGRTDVIVGLYWEDKTRRFLNEKTEYVIFGWQDSTVPVPNPEPLARPDAGLQPQKNWWEDGEDDGDLPY